MEILDKSQYDEYEEFVSHHKNGELTQSVLWQNVKNNWKFEAVVSRDKNGKIQGSCGVLIRKLPIVPTTFMYVPRGPICDWHNEAILKDLKSGLDTLAKKYKAQVVKIDPYISVNDREFADIMKKMGFKRFYDEVGFETIQARFNYVLNVKDKTEEDILKGMTQKARYNLRYSTRHDITVKVGSASDLDEFMRIYKVTGERDGFSIRPKDYFERMLAMGEDKVRLYMGYYKDKAVCGAITSNYASKCSYIYGASDNAYRQYMPNYLMQYEMIKWALETKCEIYDFQGIAGDIENTENPMYGLYRFKKGFGGEIVELLGEYDYEYKPFMCRLMDFGMKLRKGRNK